MENENDILTPEDDSIMTPEDEAAAHDAALEAAEGQREDAAIEQQKTMTIMDEPEKLSDEFLKEATTQKIEPEIKKEEPAAEPADKDAVSDTMKEVITKLKAERDQAVILKEEIQKAEVLFREQNADIFAKIGATSTKVAELEDQLRNLGDVKFKSLNPTYSEDADLKNVKLFKDMGFGVKVRVSEKPEYDAAVAFEWAKEKNMSLIPQSLDVKKFDKLAKSERFDFVKFKNSHMITLPSKIVIE